MTRPIERFNRPQHVGPVMVVTSGVAGTKYVAAGYTTLSSGSASVTVSTTAINSDSLVMHASKPGSIGVVVSSGDPRIVVNSVVSAVSFALARADGSTAPWDETVMWELKLTS